MSRQVCHSDAPPFYDGLPADWSISRLDRSRRGSDCQGIFLVSTAQKRFVIKVFGPKCGPMRHQLNRIDHHITGRSAPDPTSRYQTEKRALRIWRQNGFDVFGQLDNEAELDIPYPYLLMEYVHGPTLKNHFRDANVSVAAKKRVLKRFVPEWSRRHHLAKRNAERFLIQEHASFKHVLLADDGRLISFDFEEIFTQRFSPAFLIGREIAGYLRSLYRVTSPAEFDTYLDIILDYYSPTEFLQYPYRYFFHHPNQLLRWSYGLIRQLPANRRENSRYAVIQRLQNRLEQRI